MIQDNSTVKDILSRTSIRRFTDAKVDKDYIDTLLHAAMSAPSGVNRQPWEILVIDNKDLLKELADALPYAKMVANAPVAFLLCGDSTRFLEDDDATLWVQDLSAASENVLLAAHALGLGGVWTCLYPHPDRMKAVSGILNIPDRYVPFNLIPVGYPAPGQHPRDKWDETRVHYNSF